MHVWILRIAAICGCWLVGCGPTPPPVVAPGPATGGTNSATVTVDVPPETPPSAIQPKTTKPPSVQPAQPPPKDSLLDLASRLVEPTGQGGWRISEPAALELERLGPDAPAQLLPLMSDERLEVRRGAAFHLLSTFDPSSPEQVAAFTKALDDQDATLRNIGLQAVRQLSPAEIAATSPQLLALLDPTRETKPENRAAIARLAGNLGPKGTAFIDGLATSATKDGDPRVRSAAIFALTQVAPPEQALSTLRSGLTDKQAAVRLVAAGRLRSLASKADPAVADLGQALADQDERVRTAAAEALVLIGDKSVPALRTALESKDVNAKKLALACLSSLGPAAKDALPAIEKAQQDADANVREAAKVLAGRLKP